LNLQCKDKEVLEIMTTFALKIYQQKPIKCLFTT